MSATPPVQLPAAPWLPRWLTPARLVMAVFVIQAAAANSWFPRIPDVQAKLGLGPADLSIALLGGSLGGFAMTFLVAKVVERLTARRAIALGFVLYCIAQTLPGWAWNVPSLFAALFVIGARYLIIDLATNVEATRIQDALGRRILSRCHGFWSIGSMIGLVLGSVFAEYAIDVRWHLLAIGIVAMPLGIAAARALPTFAPSAEPVERAPLITLPSVAMIGLCVFAFGVLLAELTTRNWAAVYLREALHASPAAIGVAFAGFSMFMAIGRLTGDRFADRFGPVVLGRFCSVVAVAGLVVLLLASNVAMPVVALVALGVGVSVGFPLAVSAAAALGDRSPARNVAALSLVGYSGSIVGPPLVGFVAESAGLRWGLTAILPLMILSALFAGSLRRKA